MRKRFLFSTEILYLLPDHLQFIWILPEGDSRYFVRWKEIKCLFTLSYLDQIGSGETNNPSREKRGEAAIWQRRFCEHAIRDEADVACHIDYIHFNPVKHGMAEDAADWPWSSFHRFARTGYYPDDWGKTIENSVKELVCGE